MSTKPTPPDVRKEAGWQKAVEQECARIKEVAHDRDLGFTIANLWCKVDPLTADSFKRPRPLALVGLFEGDTDDEVEASKDYFARSVMFAGVAGDSVANTISTEAWISTGVTDPDNAVRPSQDPNRTEALVVMAFHREFGGSMHTAPITRPEGVRTIGAWDTRWDASEGRFSLMPPPDAYKFRAEAMKVCQMLFATKAAQWAAVAEE
jgi:hypothetical protein